MGKIYSLIFCNIYNDDTEEKECLITSIRICRWWISQETHTESVWHEHCGSPASSQPLFLNERLRQTEWQLLPSALRWSGEGLSRQGKLREGSDLRKTPNMKRLLLNFQDITFLKCQALLLLTKTIYIYMFFLIFSNIINCLFSVIYSIYSLLVNYISTISLECRWNSNGIKVLH